MMLLSLMLMELGAFFAKSSTLYSSPFRLLQRAAIENMKSGVEPSTDLDGLDFRAKQVSLCF
jgi:hypothetical protein